MSQFDSSKTRVQPFFCELLGRDSTGADWLSCLLTSASRSREIVDDELLDRPGTLLEDLVASVPGAGFPLCFERRAAPPARFLAWLIQNAPSLAWPRQGDEEQVFGEETQMLRRQLVSNDEAERGPARRRALALLRENGARGSRGAWWAFEGFTAVDCWLETERLILFVEGKRKERLSPATNWLPKRNQIVRNLEVVVERAEAAGKAGFALLACDAEHPVNDIDSAVVEAGTPHLSGAGRQRIESAYLGRISWQDLCEACDVPDGALPNSVADARPTCL